MRALRDAAGEPYPANVWRLSREGADERPSEVPLPLGGDLWRSDGDYGTCWVMVW